MLIYLASPYSHPDRGVEIERYHGVMEFMTWISTRTPDVVYSPILHSHDWADKYSLPKDANWWRKHNMTILRRCDKLWVLRLDGWEESKGVAMEMQFARDLDLPIMKWRWLDDLQCYSDL